ncbi:12801_t:CDS:2, partial [Racocetra fulgida]
MEPFQVTMPILKLILCLQKYIKESPVALLHFTNNTIEFLNTPDINEDLMENQMPLFIEDLHQVGDPMKELCKIEDHATLFQHYYQLGERLAMHDWDEEVKKKMKNRFTYQSYKNALRITHHVYSLYYIRGAHNLLTTCHLSANILLEMNIENFNLLLEKAWLGSQKEIEQ